MYHEDPTVERVIAYVENRHAGFHATDDFFRNIVFDTIREYNRLCREERHREVQSRGFQRN